MTWMLVSVSKAPVGSSARMMSGSLTMARAMATRCIWPPDISLGALAQLAAQAHLFQGFLGPAAALPLGHAGEGQGQFHVLQHRLVGDQVVALEDKADGVVPVGVPVPVFKVPWWTGR